MSSPLGPSDAMDGRAVSGFQMLTREAVWGSRLPFSRSSTGVPTGDGRPLATRSEIRISPQLGPRAAADVSDEGLAEVKPDPHLDERRLALPAENAYRDSELTANPFATPAPATDCPATFGNTDIFGGAYSP